MFIGVTTGYTKGFTMSHTRVRIEDKQFWITSQSCVLGAYGVLRKGGWAVYGVSRYEIARSCSLEGALRIALSEVKAHMPTVEGVGYAPSRISRWFARK